MTRIMNKRWYDRRDEDGKIVRVDIEILLPTRPGGLPRRSLSNSPPRPTETMDDPNILRRVLGALRHP